MAAPPALTPLRIDSSDLPCILNKKSNSHDRRVRQVGRYLRPQALEDAVAALADGGYTVLAGGTDVYPARVGDRKSVVEGQSVSVRVDLGGRRSIKKKKHNNKLTRT